MAGSSRMQWPLGGTLACFTSSWIYMPVSIMSRKEPSGERLHDSSGEGGGLDLVLAKSQFPH